MSGSRVADSGSPFRVYVNAHPTLVVLILTAVAVVIGVEVVAFGLLP